MVNFCLGTYYYAEALVVQKGNPLKIHSFADLKGKKIGTLLGTNYAEWLRGVAGIDSRAYEDWAEVIQDLALGRIDAASFTISRWSPLRQGSSGVADRAGRGL